MPRMVTTTRGTRGLAGSAIFPGGVGRWPRGQTVDSVTEVLREAILTGQLGPSTWLRETDIADELSVSRTPIREALRRLVAEGLVVKRPGQGTIVAPMSIEDVLAVYLVRESLEGLAARLAAGRSSPRVAAALSALIERMQDPQLANDLPQLVELNLELHRAIRDATGNSYLKRFLTQVEHAVRRLDRTTYELPGRIEESLAEHRGIVEAIIAADPQQAERLAVQHMRRAREIRTQMLLGG